MHRTDRSLLKTCLHKTFLISATLASVTLASFEETREITSNRIISLTGAGDTIWAATDQGLNFSENGGEDWSGFRISDLSSRFYGMTFGNGVLGALLLDHTSQENNTNFWIYNHSQGNQSQFSISRSSQWHRTLNNNRDIEAHPRSLIKLHNDFWVAWGDGGLVRLSRSGESEVFTPGNPHSQTTTQMIPDLSDWTTTRVLSVSPLQQGDETKTLLVATPSALWHFDTENNSWDSSGYSDTLLSGENFVSFHSAVSQPKSSGNAVYAMISSKPQGADSAQAGFFRFSPNSFRWSRVLSEMPDLVSFAADQYMYTVKENDINLYIDSVDLDQDFTSPLSNHIADNVFRSRMSVISGNIYPSSVEEILFIPTDEITGRLVIGTSAGIYIADNVDPANSSDLNFRLVQHFRKIKAQESYALPGIIRSSNHGRYDRAVFVYRLSRDANVDINVYDYNMNLVKSVVSGARRDSQTSTGRSTDPSADWWDGTDRSGRPVAPGIYYFKITSTGGDRFFGKIIVAK
ncbi:hypothetical protein CHISP_2333 [Chitinispirillum alkaliphilum]|nr:hypothetical protein CHISP_2333 [Chitinispirillum alkaliphilum]